MILSAESGLPDSALESVHLPLQRNEVSILSPLRYPGSKRRLAAYVGRSLELNRLHPDIFIEPFAGGASVALQLLNDGQVRTIGLADADPLVAAFWQTVFFDADWLVDQVSTTDISLERWDQLKRQRHTDRRTRALACLFLNRTSFSGILARSAGPIGGRKQTSVYELACRFPRATLIRRIRQAERLRKKVQFVWNLPWRTTMGRVRQMTNSGTMPQSAFYYFDPPFIHKAPRLYNVWFAPEEHCAFRNYVVRLADPWIVSYDAAPEALELYAGQSETDAHVEVLYTGSGPSRRRMYETIVSNLTLLPAETRLWRRTDEWQLRTQNGGTHNAATG